MSKCFVFSLVLTLSTLCLGSSVCQGAGHTLTLSQGLNACPSAEHVHGFLCTSTFPAPAGSSDVLNLGLLRGIPLIPRGGYKGRHSLVAAFSFLAPGTGHFLLNSLSATVTGIVHMTLDLACLGFVAWAANYVEEPRRAEYVVYGVLIMLGHRFECLLEAIIWRSVYRHRGHPGTVWRPRLSFYCAPEPEGTCIGASLDVKF